MMLKPKQNWFEKLVKARRILTPRPPESCPLSTSSTRESARAHSPARSHRIELSDPVESPGYHCANEPEPFFLHVFSSSCLSVLGSCFLLAFVTPAFAAVREVGSVGLTVDSLARELNFFTNTLPFELVSISEASGREPEALLGL